MVAAACAPSRLSADDIRPLPYYSTGTPDRPAWGNPDPVPGLRAAIARATVERPVKLLTVHGMITSEPNYSTSTLKALTSSLKLSMSGDPVPINLARGYEIQLVYGPQPADVVPAKMTSRLTRTIWVDEAQVPKLIAYELFWAPIRDDLKYRYLGCFESRSSEADRARAAVPWDCPKFGAKRNTGARALANGWLKDGLMVRGFADAVIANGATGDVLRDDLSLATCVMATDVIAYRKRFATAAPTAAAAPTLDVLETFEKKRCDAKAVEAQLPDFAPSFLGPGGSNLEYFAITYSLGSYLFLEAQARGMFDRADQADPVQFAMFDGGTIYMFANQVSLLTLANLSGVCLLPPPEGEPSPPEKVEACPNWRLKTPDQWVDDMMDRSVPGRLATYVAFNDPSDALGFELPPFLADAGLGRLINVTVRNPAFTIPFLLRSPSDVHTKHDQNDAIIDALVNGITIPATARP